MKIAIFSDIHANLPALEAVLHDIDEHDPDMVYCLGDLVGYNVWPNEVVEEIRKRRIPVIAGNYDVGVGLNSDDCGCAYKTDGDKQRGSVSIAYTNDVVTPVVRQYLRQLPRHLRIEFGSRERTLQLLMVHGSPRKVNEYLFEDRKDASLLRMMVDANADIMLFGHTHKPYHRVLRTEVHQGTRHAINTGSVGKPRDGDPRACYVILELDPDGAESAEGHVDVKFIRVTYDIEKAARAVENSPLPDAFGDMLRNAY